MSKLKIYIAAVDNGGWAFDVHSETASRLHSGTGKLKKYTFVEGELMACLAAIEWCVEHENCKDVVVVTEKDYLVKAVKFYIAVWKKNNWITAKGTEVLCRNLWESLDEVLEDVEAEFVYEKFVYDDPRSGGLKTIAQKAKASRK